MGKRKTQQTLISGDEIGEEGNGAGFFACYLLTSLCPRFKGHTYIGYTLNPRRRIRQHNGEIGSGAWRTKRRRPWEMVLCIYGFPTNVAALQFEWAWQHPVESLAVRTAAASFKSLSGLANKIKLAYTMLTLPAWQDLNLTVNLFSTKYQSYTSACPPLPEQMRTRVCSMDELPCYNVNGDECDDDNECEGSFLDSTEEDDQGPSFTMNESPDRKSFPMASLEIVEDNMPRTEVVELTNTTTTDLVADKDQVLAKSDDIIIISHEIEIIDVFTPSPCKKRGRGRSVGPEIIDLTNSPLYV